MGLTPGPGRFHVTQGNCALEPQLLKHMCPEPVLTARGAQQREAHRLQLGSGPLAVAGDSPSSAREAQPRLQKYSKQKQDTIVFRV